MRVIVFGESYEESFAIGLCLSVRDGTLVGQDEKLKNRFWGN